MNLATRIADFHSTLACTRGAPLTCCAGHGQQTTPSSACLRPIKTQKRNMSRNANCEHSSADAHRGRMQHISPTRALTCKEEQLEWHVVGPIDARSLGNELRIVFVDLDPRLRHSTHGTHTKKRSVRTNKMGGIPHHARKWRYRNDVGMLTFPSPASRNRPSTRKFCTPNQCCKTIQPKCHQPKMQHKHPGTWTREFVG